MKRAAFILLICIYSLSTLGIGLKKFYCCGKLASVTVSFVEEGHGKINKEDCCNTIYNSLKIEDKHLAAEKISILQKYYLDVFQVLDFNKIANLVPQQLQQLLCGLSPPLHEKVPIYIYNCVFRV